jgi:hypothetical protein
MRLINKFDYEEFKHECIGQNIVPFPVLEFAQKSGIATCAIKMYPELSPSEAYLKFIQLNQIPPTPNTVVENSQGGCSGCGSNKEK